MMINFVNLQSAGLTVGALQCKTQWMIDTVFQIVIFEAVFISM